MKIGVIGTINKDFILPFRHAPIESIGGILYDISVLSALLGPEDEIIPVSYLGFDLYDALVSYCQNRSNVSSAGLIPIDQRNHNVILEYHTKEDRNEKSLFPFPALTREQVEIVADADIIIVNFISGWDLELSALEYLSKVAGDRLYMDVHYLLMGRDKIGKRFPQLPPDIDKWLAAPTWLQMNENELRQIAGQDVNAKELHERQLRDDQILLSTNGADDTLLVYREEGIVCQQAIPTYAVPNIIDTTGCGDCFGAGFSAYFTKHKELSAAVAFGNCVAAANTMLQGTNEMDKLRQTMKEIADLPENKQKVLSDWTIL